MAPPLSIFSGILAISLLSASCRDRSVTIESQHSLVDTNAKAAKFRNQPPNVTSIQLTYDSGRFAVDTIAARNGVITKTPSEEEAFPSSDSHTYLVTVFRDNATPYVTHVRVNPSKHTFEYDKEKDHIPHANVKSTRTHVNVNIPLDSLVIRRITIQEVVERDGVFIVPDTLKSRPVQDIIIRQPIK